MPEAADGSDAFHRRDTLWCLPTNIITNHTRQYIVDNPTHWNQDEHHPDHETASAKFSPAAPCAAPSARAAAAAVGPHPTHRPDLRRGRISFGGELASAGPQLQLVPELFMDAC